MAWVIAVAWVQSLVCILQAQPKKKKKKENVFPSEISLQASKIPTYRVPTVAQEVKNLTSIYEDLSDP